MTLSCVERQAGPLASQVIHDVSVEIVGRKVRRKYGSVVWCECRECKERRWEGSTRPMVWCKDGVGTGFPPMKGKRAYTVIDTRVSSS